MDAAKRIGLSLLAEVRIHAPEISWAMSVGTDPLTGLPHVQVYRPGYSGPRVTFLLAADGTPARARKFYGRPRLAHTRDNEAVSAGLQWLNSSAPTTSPSSPAHGRR